MTAWLTIAIPTYNRAANLAFLLEFLQREIFERAEVVVVVSDNASTDDTAVVTATAKSDWPTLTVIRNAANVGAEANVAQLFTCATTPYIWIIGDDDVPYTGAIAALLAMLRCETPDLVALPSAWVADVRTVAPRTIGDPRGYALLDALRFARRVNVWTTFLSGIVVRKASFPHADEPAAIRRFAGSNLIQLGWVLGSLGAGTRFVAVRDPWVVATGGASGGYAVIKTFGVTLADIAEAVLGPGSAAAHAVIGRTLTGFLPQLVWNVRFGDGAQFYPEDIGAVLRTRLSRYFAYRLIIRPIAEGPKPVAWVMLGVARLVAAALRSLDSRR